MQANNTVPSFNRRRIAGSNDPLLDRTINLFNTLYPDHVAVFGNLGSMGGLKALRQNLCHIASSHLLQDDEAEYNFDFATQELRRGYPSGMAPFPHLTSP